MHNEKRSYLGNTITIEKEIKRTPHRELNGEIALFEYTDICKLRVLGKTVYIWKKFRQLSKDGTLSL